MTVFWNERRGLWGGGGGLRRGDAAPYMDLLGYSEWTCGFKATYSNARKVPTLLADSIRSISKQHATLR